MNTATICEPGAHGTPAYPGHRFTEAPTLPQDAARAPLTIVCYACNGIAIMERTGAAEAPAEGAGWMAASYWRTGFPVLNKSGQSKYGWWRIAPHTAGTGAWRNTDGTWQPPVGHAAGA